MSLIQELHEKNELLHQAINSLAQRGKAWTKARYNYRVAIYQKMTQERANGVPTTLIKDMCKGDPDIAALEMERDNAEILYKATSERINEYKIQIRLLDNQISREWEQAGNRR